MIKVKFDPGTLTGDLKDEWDKWSARALAATVDIIRQWEDLKVARREWKEHRQGPAPEFDPKFDSKVWTDFRTWLLDNFFHNKCAYCETPINGFLGDAEHFRPKGRVRDLKDDGSTAFVKVTDEDGDEMNHPGYFWLAYHWQNLLPSCELCNRYGAKQDFFPVVAGHIAVKRLENVSEIDDLIKKMTASMHDKLVYYLEPDDLDRIEVPVLLHPYKDDPEQSIHFKKTGEAAAWEEGDKRAEKSIRIYALNHKKKLAARVSAQLDGRQRYVLKISAIADRPDFLEKAKEMAQEFKKDYYEGERPYAVAIFDFLDFWFPLVSPDALLGPRRVRN